MQSPLSANKFCVMPKKKLISTEDARTLIQIAKLALVEEMRSDAARNLPVKALGHIIFPLTGWPEADFLGLMNAFRESELLNELATDSALLLSYAPARKFASKMDLLNWAFSVPALRDSIEMTVRWGFMPKKRSPKHETRWNAFLFAAFHTLAKHKNGFLDREHFLYLFLLLGFERDDALKVIFSEAPPLH
jgi:hypothetical protein